jgi:hypothetical protein
MFMLLSIPSQVEVTSLLTIASISQSGPGCITRCGQAKPLTGIIVLMFVTSSTGQHINFFIFTTLIFVAFCHCPLALWAMIGQRATALRGRIIAAEAQDMGIEDHQKDPDGCRHGKG